MAALTNIPAPVGAAAQIATAVQGAFPVLETERLHLRAPQSSDYPVFDAFLRDARSTFIGGHTEDSHRIWRVFTHIAGMWMLRGYGSFVFCHRGAEDTPLGMAGPWHPLDWPEAEIGWTIWTAEAEGQGIAYEAVTAARDYAFGTLGWRTAVSYIDPANARSIALAERLGATLDPKAKGLEDSDLVYRHPTPVGAA